MRKRRARNLKDLREDANLTQRQLSDFVDITQRNLYAWEQGDSAPRLDRAVLLARALGVSLRTIAEAFDLDTEGIPNDDDRHEVQ